MVEQLFILKAIENAVIGLPEEIPSAGYYFCCECHEEVEVERYSEPVDYDTNSGGTWYISPCCGADLYRLRTVVETSPGRPPRYVYPASSRHEFDGPDYECDDWEYE